MNKLLTALLMSAAMAPALTYAQSATPITRSEVQAQVAQAERDGDLHQSKVHYPDMHSGNASHANQGYGSYVEGNAESGRITRPPLRGPGQSLYSHH